MSKIALVTGGTRGIGESISKKLKEDGLTVIANYSSNDDAAKKFSDENQIDVFKCDVGNYESCSDMIDKIYDQHSSIDVLINNASTFYPTIIKEASLDEWDDLHDVNLKSPFFLSQHFFSSLKKNRGCIINIIDILAIS